MAINPDNITTIRVDQLAPATLDLTKLVPIAEVNGELKQSTIQDLADLIATTISASGGVGFLPLVVTNGQQLPDVPTDASFFLCGAGTYLNINGYPDVICTEALNAVVSLTDHWQLAVEIPIVAEVGVQTVTGSAVDNTDPLNPVINEIIDGVQTIVAGTNITVDNTDPSNPIISASGVGGSVDSVTGTLVDNTDPANPVIDIPTIQQTATAGSPNTDFSFSAISSDNTATMDIDAQSMQMSVSNNAGSIFYRLFRQGIDAFSDPDNYMRLFELGLKFVKNGFSTNVEFADPTGTTGKILFPNVVNATKTVAMTDQIPTVDATPTDGSSNAVSSNGVFDALALKQDKVSGVSDTEISFLDGVTSAIQTQLNTKQTDLFEFDTKQGFYLFEDFLGDGDQNSFATGYGFMPNASGTGAVCSPTITYPNRTNQQGVIQLGSGTTATGSSNIRLGDNNAGTLYLGQGILTMQFFVNIETLSDATNRFYSIIGANTGANFANTNGIFFIYDEGGVGNYGTASANWKCITRNSTTTSTITSTAVTASQWYVLRIVINANASSIEFFINGTSVATHTTNIPTLVTPRIAQVKTVGTTSRNVFCDYMVVRQIYTTPRTI